MSQTVKAWHFVGNTLRNGDPVPADGEVLRHDGEIVWCQSGLYASLRLIDALRFAPGTTICRDECSEIGDAKDDKLVCRQRVILWRVDGEELLRDFARRCALDVIHLWDAPDVVVRYLKTGNENLRCAARDAAGNVVLDAARDTARCAAKATRDAASNVVLDFADECAAYAVARLAAPAAWDDAWDAVRDKQNRRLTSMVMAARRRELANAAQD